MPRWAFLAIAAAAGVLALERYGRARYRAELGADEDATLAASSISFLEAAQAGARAIAGGKAVPQTVVYAERAEVN